MRKTVSIVALALLASACSKPAPAPEATTDAMASATAVPGGMAIDGQPNAGTFETTNGAGKKWVTTVMADGTASMVKDGKTTTGTWTSTGPGNFCDTFDGKTSCYKEEIINGVYTSTNEADPKDVSTIRRMTTGIAPSAGTYEVTTADGKPNSTVVIRADGGYTDTPAKGLAVSGVVKMVDGKTCFDPSGKAEPACFIDSARAADGSFTATAPDGTVLNVKPKA